jgi:hypothetical protein
MLQKEMKERHCEISPHRAGTVQEEPAIRWKIHAASIASIANPTEISGLLLPRQKKAEGKTLDHSTLRPQLKHKLQLAEPKLCVEPVAGTCSHGWVGQALLKNLGTSDGDRQEATVIKMELLKAPSSSGCAHRELCANDFGTSSLPPRLMRGRRLRLFSIIEPRLAPAVDGGRPAGRAAAAASALANPKDTV